MSSLSLLSWALSPDMSSLLEWALSHGMSSLSRHELYLSTWALSWHELSLPRHELLLSWHELSIPTWALFPVMSSLSLDMSSLSRHELSFPSWALSSSCLYELSQQIVDHIYLLNTAQTSNAVITLLGTNFALNKKFSWQMCIVHKISVCFN